MRAVGKFIWRIVSAVLAFLFANYFALKIEHGFFVTVALIGVFLAINIYPSLFISNLKTEKLRNLANGTEALYVFLLSSAGSILFNVLGWFGKMNLPVFSEAIGMWIGNAIFAILIESVLFWNGMIRIFVASEQLAIKWRVIAVLCGLIPIVHLVVLGIMLSIVSREVKEENQKLVVNEKRKESQVCKTKYPMLFVHGVFFRDFRYLNYWGRISEELQKNGAIIFYGNQQSAATVEECGKELDARIRQICRDYGVDKVNIVAHSKGGLDSRYAISMCNAHEHVASLTTINTPHRGCEFADYLLSKIGPSQQQFVANAYNATLRKFGDHNPDFLGAVYDLTAKRCQELNEVVLDHPDVYYQSVGSTLKKSSGGRFPLNFTYQLAKYFDGPNDGLVGEKSFPWGERFQMLSSTGKRGISHGDMIDLNRENFKGFDVREFYVELLSDLKARGF